MCGIVGVVGEKDVVPYLLDGLRRLEYRMAMTVRAWRLSQMRGSRGVVLEAQIGELAGLPLMQSRCPVLLELGIPAGRPHGRPGEENAHPHSDGRVAVVHNGIIENYISLRAELEGQGYVFESDTDTETVVHLISHYWKGCPARGSGAPCVIAG